MSVCVFTACAGAYDLILRPHPHIEGVDFVAFTDRPMETDHWRVLDVLPDSDDPRLMAKLYKVLGPQMTDLKPYDVTIWLDSNIEIVNPDFIDEALADLGPDGFALHRHSYRDDLMEEARYTAQYMRKYDGQPILQQAQHYTDEGIPAHGGLWSCASMARTRSEKLDRAMQDWWHEIEEWSLQDQLSLPYVLMVDGIEPHAWPHYPPGSLQAPNPWLTNYRHVDGS